MYRLIASCLVLTACCATTRPEKAKNEPFKFALPNIKLTALDVSNSKNAIEYINFSVEVDSASANAFLKRLKEANEENASAVVVEINSPGGRVDAGWQIVRAIERSHVPVVCVVDGEAASMAMIILQACDLRAMTKRSVLMAHEISLSGEFEGQPNDWQAKADYLRAMEEALLEMYTKKMAMSVDEMRKRTDGGRQFWMNWREAKHYKAIDFVADSVESVLLRLANA